ncbi:MAG: enoyl-CoA hydratase family protein [Nocardioidaceae bacterium]|nr:enoyl-CoA hydratase family protein [Nocardioidaceae bacterium]
MTSSPPGEPEPPEGDQHELVHLDLAGGVATVTLDSPSNRNALSHQLLRELSRHLQSAERAAGIRVIVLTHTGNTFCAGADLAEAMETGMEQATRSLLSLLRLVVELDKPVLALVRGHVRAGGVGLVGACDLALVSEESTFAFSESLLGLAPAIISLTTRARIGDRDAARKYLTGAPFDGVEAARSGLVTEAVPMDTLDARLAQLIADLERVSPQGLRETKRLLNAELSRRMQAEGDALVQLSARLFASAEAREGMRAFRERRPPSWAVQSDERR